MSSQHQFIVSNLVKTAKEKTKVMTKKLSISILIIIVSTVSTFGQHIKFEKNINSRASELLQYLNKDGDSLFLESRIKPISQVVVFNDDFSESININNNKTQIDLKSLPLGDFIIQAKIDKKWIVMYLEKNDDLKLVSSGQEELAVGSQLKSAKIKNNQSPLYYWVVSESNSNFGSRKSMKLEYTKDVVKLISKNKLELQSEIGKHNKLSVYAVYNKSEFMTKQLRNPDYYKSVDYSNAFNTKPFYTSEPSAVNDSMP